MGRSADREPEQDEAAQDTKLGRGRLARTREMLELATPLVAVLLTLGSALLKLAVERLPTLQPIGVVLMVFLAFLSVSAIVQLLLFWRELATPHARAEFLHGELSGAADRSDRGGNAGPLLLGAVPGRPQRDRGRPER